MLVSNFLFGAIATATLGYGRSMPSSPCPPPLVYLFTVYATESPLVIIGNGGHGSRLFIPITGGTVTGPKLQGKSNVIHQYHKIGTSER